MLLRPYQDVTMASKYARHGATPWGWKPSGGKAIASQAMRNWGRVTDRGKEEWSENAGRRTETGCEA